MLALFIPLVVLVIIVVLIANRQALRGERTAWQPRRILSYTLAFAGLMAVLYAAAGLLALAVTTATLQANLLISQNDVRSRASFYLAALIVGLPILLGFWRPAQRRAAASADERDAGERRLFLAAVFATAAVVALFALQRLLAVVFTAPAPASLRPSVLDGIGAGAQVLVWGAAWLWFARLGWRERGPRDKDELHDLAVYVLSGFALAFFSYGLYAAIHDLVGDLVSAGPPLLDATGWATWGTTIAWLLAGGGVWVAIWRYDLIRGGHRAWRVAYLYLVLAVAVPTALYGAGDGLYEILRRLFGYNDSWGFLRDALSLPLVAGAVWAYHWQVVRNQATTAGAPAQDGAIPWPRRPAIALMTLLGLAVAAPAFISLVWLGLDFALGTGIALSGADWWRDRVSIGLAGGAVGSALWLSGWARLQWAARAASAHERTARSRQFLLQAIVLAGALCALGFTIALLWQLIQMLLGVAPDSGAVNTTLKYAATALITAALAAYHGLVLRRDMRLRPTAARRIRVVALVAEGAEAALADLRRDGQPIEMLGHLRSALATGASDPDALRAELAALGARDDVDGALLILGAGGGHLYAYGKAPGRQAQHVDAEAAASGPWPYRPEGVPPGAEEAQAGAPQLPAMLVPPNQVPSR